LSNDLQTASEQAVQLVAALSRHDRMTRGHTERVRAYADVIAQEMRLSGDELEHLRWGMLLHDIGKLNVPVEILNKPGTPTEAEWAIIRTHPAQAARLLLPLEPWLGHWVLAATEHHEWWDGSGYPLGLKGDEIPLSARLMALADVFDALISKRHYKVAFPLEESIRIIVDGRGKHFDPRIVDCFLQRIEDFTSIADRYADHPEDAGKEDS
uniref:HD-GYP domain-containing protein n=1 Tax=uncultured Azonexus sp. TaxID=520307 RepID=UPI00260F2605